MLLPTYIYRDGGPSYKTQLSPILLKQKIEFDVVFLIFFFISNVFKF